MVATGQVCLFLAISIVISIAEKSFFRIQQGSEKTVLFRQSFFVAKKDSLPAYKETKGSVHNDMYNTKYN